MTAPIDTMPKLGSSSASSSSNRACDPARTFPAGLRGLVNWRPGRAARARGGGKPEDCDPSEAGAERDRRPERDRKDATGDRQNRVADDPAEASGERPPSRRRKQGGDAAAATPRKQRPAFNRGRSSRRR